MGNATITADVAVIGLGAMGAAALYQLARRGVRAIGIDRFDPPHDRGSSHGETRITRQAVGEGALYAPLVLRSHAIWRELEAATGQHLLNACGGAIIGPVERDSSHHGKPDFLKRTVAVAERFGIAHEVMDRADLMRHFPQFIGLQDGDMACYEPGAGFLYAERCVAAQLTEARRHGARTLTGTTVGGLSEDSGLIRIATDAGTVEATRAIVTAGPWIAPLLGAPFDRWLTVSRQVLHWFEAEDPASYRPGRFPVFIRMHGAGDSDYFYGFPASDGGPCVKLATEHYDHAIQADALDRQVRTEEAAAMHQDHIAGRLAGVTARVSRSIACLYTNTPDADFLIDTHPAMERVLVVSACSGHGFKHSAAIGEQAAEWFVHGAPRLDLRPFGLARFG